MATPNLGDGLADQENVVPAGGWFPGLVLAKGLKSVLDFRRLRNWEELVARSYKIYQKLCYRFILCINWICSFQSTYFHVDMTTSIIPNTTWRRDSIIISSLSFFLARYLEEHCSCTLIYCMTLYGFWPEDVFSQKKHVFVGPEISFPKCDCLELLWYIYVSCIPCFPGSFAWIGVFLRCLSMLAGPSAGKTAAGCAWMLRVWGHLCQSCCCWFEGVWGN